LRRNSVSAQALCDRCYDEWCRSVHAEAQRLLRVATSRWPSGSPPQRRWAELYQ
jgi:hypothetical protein